jgi:hypothetical protein
MEISSLWHIKFLSGKYGETGFGRFLPQKGVDALSLHLFVNILFNIPSFPWGFVYS